MKSRPYQMPGGFTVTFEFDGRVFQAEWAPRVPKGRKAKRLIPHYRAARDEWLIGQQTAMGGRIMVVEL